MARMTMMTDPLPEGWRSFCSVPCDGAASHWYAVPPWRATGKLAATVYGVSWPDLHARVQSQAALRELSTQPHPPSGGLDSIGGHVRTTQGGVRGLRVDMRTGDAALDEHADLLGRVVAVGPRR